jgi:hypothetical protein
MSNKQETISNFIIQNATNELLPDYFNKCYENLKDLNKRSEKFSIAYILLFLLHLAFKENSIGSFSVGPVNINDVSVIPKLLPIATIYILFNMNIIENQKKDLIKVIKTLSYTLYKQDFRMEDLKSNRFPLMTRLLLPFSISTMINAMFERKPSVTKSIISILLIVPFFIIILMPFYFLYQMLLNVYDNYYCDTLGFLSFWISIWFFIATLFYGISTGMEDNKEESEFLKMKNGL